MITQPAKSIVGVAIVFIMAWMGLKYMVLTGGIAAVGWVVMKYTSPTKDDMIKVSLMYV